MIQLIESYFPDLDAEQRRQFAELPALYAEWNAKINVISRQDIENLEERHVLHSLAIAKEFDFKPGARLLDLGTGGGFPGIPLAILFPEVQFVLADSIGSIKVASNVDEESPDAESVRLELGQALGQHVRTEFNIPGLQLGLRYAGSPVVAQETAGLTADQPNVYIPSASPGAR